MNAATRELLELAAKAAGYGLPGKKDHDEISRQYGCEIGLWVQFPWGWGWFRPHIDDGEALRLAVKLNLKLECMTGQTAVRTFDNLHAGCVDHTETQKYAGREFRQNPYASTRLAILLAAASIGRQMLAATSAAVSR